jgi:hypothetical protein
MRHLLFHYPVVYVEERERERESSRKLTDCGYVPTVGIKLASACGDCMYRDRGNDGLVSSAIRFRGTLGNPKEATGNGRAVDRVICESLPEGYIRT